MKGTDVTERLGDCCAGFPWDVRMELYGRKEFFVQWSRTGSDLLVKTSDYISDAQDSVLRGIALMVCRRMQGKVASLPQEFFDLVRSDQFIVAKRPIYVKRSRNLTCSDIGRDCAIFDSVQRLLDCGLLSESDIDNSYFSWTKGDPKRRVGFCSTMFRVVGISSILDDSNVPDSVRDYVVYHECLHLRQKFRIPHNAHTGLFREWEHRFPDWQTAEAYLSRL